MCKDTEAMCNEVKKEVTIQNIKALMKNTSLSIDQILVILEIPKDERDAYHKAILNNP